MIISVVIIAFIGLMIAVYGITVERKIQQNVLYKPACDISDRISCSRAFLSPYGKILGISNIWASALYYILVIMVAMTDYTFLTLFVTCFGVAVSLVFAYILYFKVKSLCPICTSMYVINVILLFACYFS